MLLCTVKGLRDGPASGWASSHEPVDHNSISGQGTCLEFWPLSPIGGVQESDDGWFYAIMGVSIFCSLSFFLSEISKNIFLKKVARNAYMTIQELVKTVFVHSKSIGLSKLHGQGVGCPSSPP